MAIKGKKLEEAAQQERVRQWLNEWDDKDPHMAAMIRAQLYEKKLKDDPYNPEKISQLRELKADESKKLDAKVDEILGHSD